MCNCLHDALVKLEQNTLSVMINIQEKGKKNLGNLEKKYLPKETWHEAKPVVTK